MAHRKSKKKPNFNSTLVLYFSAAEAFTKWLDQLIKLPLLKKQCPHTRRHTGRLAIDHNIKLHFFFSSRFNIPVS